MGVLPKLRLNLWKIMVGVRTFLESSTIHGLSYISTTKKYVRAFWSLVVLTGFIGAIIIIYESFSSWNESPIKTTIETLPISELKFPNITVCPPKNTFTDLNYDLMLAENKTFDREKRSHLFRHAQREIKALFLKADIEKLEEENRYYNWYNGFTKIDLPFNKTEMASNMIVYTVNTSSISGVIETPYFGEKFKLEHIDVHVKFSIFVYPPESVRNNTNVTLNIKLEKVAIPLKSYRYGTEIYYLSGLDYYNIPPAENLILKSYSPPASKEYQTFTLDRDVNKEDLTREDMEHMPGFRLSWNYTGIENVESDKKYVNESYHSEFVRKVFLSEKIPL